jgi:predicted Zn finger-like uncharacterized protein
MLITCPECRTKYRVDEEKISSETVKLRCSRCGFVFTARPEEEPAPEPEAATEEDQASTEAGPSEQQEEAEAEDSFYEEIIGSAEPGYNLEQKVALKKPGLLWILTILLVVALGAGAYVLYPAWMHWIPFLDAGQSQQTVPQKEETSRSAIKNIELRDVSQYMVQNEKIGRLLVIEGKAVNESSAPKKMIKVEANLFGSKGEIIESKSFLCGNTVSLFQLQVMDRQELLSALTSKTGVVTNNNNVGPGEAVEFMTAFIQPPDSLTEFSLRVIQAREADASG